MTPEEREAAGIITVPKALLQTKASEIGIDNAQVQKMMNSDENEFYFTLDVPSCCKITSNDDSNIAISKESLLKSISEKISESERIVRAFSSDNVCNLHSSQEIVAKHSLRIDSLHSLEYMIKHTTLCQDSLERAYVTYMTLIERVNGTLSNFGNAVLLNDVSSDYIVEALNRGPAIVSSTLSGLKASAIDTLSNLLNDDVLLVSDDWLNADPARIERIIDFALSGHPIIMTGSNSRILSSDTNLPTVFSTSAGVYGLWHNEESGETYCYSDSDADVKDSIESAFEWAESHQTSESNNEQNTTPVDSIVYSLTKTHGNFGDLIIETEYDLMEIDTNLYLVTTHYTLTGDANVSTSFWDKWTAVADLRISGQHDHSTLVGYSPNSNTSTNGIQEVHLFHSYPINPHYDWEYGTGWTYNMDDAVFHDLSSQNNFSLWYDVNECQANNGNSYTIEPGTFSETVAVNQSTSATGSGLTISSYVYSEIEHYSVSFFRDRTLLPDQYETVECDMIVTLR
jgi:hypothetical protein